MRCLPTAWTLAAVMGLGAVGVSARGDEGGPSAEQLPPAAADKVDYAAQIQPLLRASCYACHGAESQEAGLRLDVKNRAFAGGDGGVVLVPGKSDESRLIYLVAGLDPEIGSMPPEGEGTPLTTEEIGLLRAWIDQGASWPDDAATEGPQAAHWSFRPVARPPLPGVRDERSVANAIDAFILARLEKESLTPAPSADKATLLRRIYLDLIGLPPPPHEVADFLADNRPDAYEQWVDRLLASPHFGERWGRRWLDLARYADSDGYEKDLARPHAWRYRQWVIEAINAGMPFDEFTIKQIAGDLLPEADLHELVASGFHRNTLHNTEGGADPEEDRVKKTVDRTNTISTIWLGLTLGCAQCHSHKYDPVTQREYFSMYAFFNGIDEANPDVPGEKDEKIQAVAESAKPRETRIHVRGDFLTLGDAVSAGTPAVLPPLAKREAGSAELGQEVDQAFNRLDLAKWIMGPENPLTARVAVNRVWQSLFGRGLVATPDDFGLQGEKPSHPGLLDWLASEFRDSGWSEKRLVRLIVTSNTYRQSSAIRTELEQVDPDNILLARQNRLRAEAEVIRDLALAASGLLDSRIGGPSVRPPQPPDRAMLTYANSAKWVVSEGGDAYRRGLYTFFQRTSPFPMFMTFDSPDSNECCVLRERSNTPLQSLTLWNDPAFYECAQSLGRRIAMESPQGETADETVRRRIDYAFHVTLAREPSPREYAAVEKLFRAQLELCRQDARSAEAILGKSPLPPGAAKDDLAAWVIVGRTLMNLDEFITRE
jgi:mono/diheme cytochrome c family protein